MRIEHGLKAWFFLVQNAILPVKNTILVGLKWDSSRYKMHFISDQSVLLCVYLQNILR